VTYAVKEIFYTLQGEGVNTGRPAVFCRFAGCNLWSGREADRAAAICQFCDTDFFGIDGDGGGRFPTPDALADAIASAWPTDSATHGRRFVVCTGGEPLLQVDDALIAALHARAFDVAVETNGTQHCPDGVDWVCVSPKAGAALRLTRGDELKLVYPQPRAMPEAFDGLAFNHFFLQPMDGPQREINTANALEYCLQHPRWRLSLQTHKLLGIR
jgi:7-carboxy-7-deazaguanine synthase